jgi:NAD dependent epimerase/dehydratase family enzyme
MFVGGPIGDGKQPVSWIHRDDVVGLILLSLDNPEAKGAINAVSPNPTTGGELAEAIGATLNRPAWFRTPPSLVALFLGEAAEIVTTGQRVYPARAVELGYEFRQAHLVPALESILAPH